ncbi:MAG: carboxymuconolactone decarboxylase family protein, partial [Candidatus Binatia bacterium]
QLRASSREKLAPENQAIWDRVMSGRSAGTGPYGTLMHAPEMAECFSALEGYFRDRGTLAKPDKEMIILAVARELGARFPWSRHEIRARQVGVRSEALETLRANGPVEPLTPHERIVIETARSLVRERKLSDELFARAQAEMGVGPLVEAVGLVGHYNFISMVARTFDLDVPPGTLTF